MAKRQSGVGLYVYVRKLISGVEYHTYELRHVPAGRIKAVVAALHSMRGKGIINLNINDGKIVFGVENEKIDEAYQLNLDPDDGTETCKFGDLTKLLQVTIQNMLGCRPRTHVRWETASVGELIFGDDWRDCPGAFTEDERNALGY